MSTEPISFAAYWRKVVDRRKLDLGRDWTDAQYAATHDALTKWFDEKVAAGELVDLGNGQYRKAADGDAFALVGDQYALILGGAA